MSYLVVNSGSSSIKFAMFDPDRAVRIFSGQYFILNNQLKLKLSNLHDEILIGEASRESFHQFSIQNLIEHISAYGLDAVGHRVVHGGEQFKQPCILQDGDIEQLEALAELAPLHQPPAIATIKLMQSYMAKLSKVSPLSKALQLSAAPQIACFDTAFHATLPELNKIFAIPQRLTQAGIRRYGFHGLAYEHLASKLKASYPALSAGRVIAAQLGSGVSLCAMEDGKSVDTTMGFTAIDGMPMSTRCGAMDVGVIFYLLEHQKMSLADVENCLYKESGLLGISGESADVRTLLASKNVNAELAIEYFCHQIAKGIAALAVSMGGIDGLVFSGGVGEHQPSIRSKIIQKLAFMGLGMDKDANQNNQMELSPADAEVKVLTIAADEELMIFQHMRDLINANNN